MPVFKLKDCCTIIAGQSPESKYYNTNGKGLPFFQGKADFGEVYPTIRVYCSQPTKIAEKDDILLSVRAPVGPTNLAPCRVCIGRGLTAIQPSEKLTTRYVLLYLRFFEAQLASKGTGTTFKAITQEVIKNLEIPVPSLGEQERIVARIEELFSELDAGVETLQKIKQQMVGYRQAIITEAFAEANCNSVRLDDISEITGGITKGRDLSGKDVIELPYLRVANVQNGYLDLSEMKEIQLCVDEKEKYLLKYGDVLFTEGGDRDKLGRGTIWRNEIPDCVHQNHIFKARVDITKAIPEYIAFWAMSTPARNYFYAKGKQSVNLASINKTILSALMIPLPDIDTQRRIVDHIQVRLSNCKSIEQTVDLALQQSAALRQSFLKQAFGRITQ